MSSTAPSFELSEDAVHVLAEYSGYKLYPFKGVHNAWLLEGPLLDASCVYMFKDLRRVVDFLVKKAS